MRDDFCIAFYRSLRFGLLDPICVRWHDEISTNSYIHIRATDCLLVVNCSSAVMASSAPRA